MPPAPMTADEPARLAALRSYELLDTAGAEAFDDIVGLAARLTGCPIALVSLVDEKRQWFKARIGLEPQETHRDLAFCAHAILEPGQPLAVADAALDPRFADNALVTAEPRIRAYLGVPLVNPEGHALGTLCVIDRTPRRFGDEVVQVMQSLARAVATTIELHRATLPARAAGLTDTLTGLASRQGFMDTLSVALARQRRDHRPFSLLCMDIDDFGRVNETLGHAGGDRILVEVARALRAATREDEVPARLGADEFGLVLVGGDGREIPTAPDRLRRAVFERTGAIGLPLRMSIGAVQFRDTPANEREAMAAANELMQAAKLAGKDRVVSRTYQRRAPRPRAVG